ncbi:MAG: hypothetical protein EOP02_32205, partial [Proteobacteria bacterium]
MHDLLMLVDELKFLAESEPALPDQGQSSLGDRWIVRSALQKAVRRGQAHRAMQLGQRLRDLDSDHLWRSLAVIAVEDVGFGDADMVTYTTAAISKTVRKLVSDDHRLMGALIRRMCAAPKSRACCELSIAVDLGRSDLIESMALQSDRDLVAALQGRNCGAVYVALGLVRGEFRGHRARTGIPRPLVEEIVADRIGRTPAAARAAVHAFRRPVDTMSLAVLPVTRLWLDQKDIKEHDELGAWPPSAEIGGFATEAWDVHTRAGGMALRAFYTSLCRRHPWVAAIPAQKASRALGAAVFVEEGGMV